MSYTELKSHPDKYLEDHLENVAKFSKSSFSSLKIKNNLLFSEISYLIGLSHDFAKSTSFFQNYILNNEKNKKTPHSFLSAVFTYYVIEDYLTSNNISFELDLAIIAYIVVLHHHGNIKNITTLDDYTEDKINSKVIKKQLKDLITKDITLDEFYNNKNISLNNFFSNFDEISEKLYDNLSDIEYDDNFKYYFSILLFYSVLLDADKMDASKSKFISRNNIPDGIVDNYKTNHSFNEFGINKIRQEAYLEVNRSIENMDLSNKIFSINLPTGIGKTLTGLSSIIKLKNRILKEINIDCRIIYSLPFLSVIDQNASVIQQIFDENNLKGSNFLLKHNYLSEMRYVNNDVYEIYDISNSKILIEGWNSEFIITTFIQFFYSILSNKNSFLRKFHNIVNSIIILDEIQSIPYRYWGILNLLLKVLAEEYNCWIILMTATQPFIFKENEIISLVDNVEYYFNQFDRIDYNFKLDNITIDEFNNDLINVINNDKIHDIMIVLNTIDSSKDIYNTIKQYYLNQNEKVVVDDDGICNIGENINLIYLSTNLIPFHRLKKINLIKNTKKQNIIITTQLIEAGVDIDVDIIYRDFAPLDSIIQTAGRCNRANEKDRGKVNIIFLINDKGKLYSSFVYQDLLLTTTYEILKDVNQISEKDFNLLASRKYFKNISKRSFDDDEIKKILNQLRFNEISSKFKLIQNLPNKIDVFVCIDNDARGIFEEYKNIIKNYKSYERKNAFLKIKSDFYKYVISVDEKKFGSANLFNDEIGVIYQEDLERKYDLDLGFIADDDENPMIW